VDVAREKPRLYRLNVAAFPVRVGLAVCGVGGGLVALILLSQLATAPPRVERAGVWIDAVHRGTFLREVSGPGTLVPEEMRWVVAREPARVEVVHVEPGESVAPETVLLELSNPDLELQALEADRELKSAEAELVELGASLEMEELGQGSLIAQLRSEQREAARQAQAGDELAKKSLIADLELTRRREKSSELQERLSLEQQRLRVMRVSREARLRVTREKVERLRTLSEYRTRQVEELRVTAGLEGVLQELSLEVGQQVTPGTLLAKVARPDRLKAELRLPEIQAREVDVGQRVRVDTRNGVVVGEVVRVDPAVREGTVTVDVRIDEKLPAGARPDQAVDGRVELEKLDDVLTLSRPAQSRPGSEMQLFVLDADGVHAERKIVRVGGTSVTEVQVLGGVAEGDRVILSDMSDWDSVDRIELE